MGSFQSVAPLADFKFFSTLGVFSNAPTAYEPSDLSVVKRETWSTSNRAARLVGVV